MQAAPHVWSQSGGKNLPNLSHPPCAMSVCGLLTSLGAARKTSEHSFKQQSTDVDKAVFCLHDTSVLKLALSDRKRVISSV